ncbi:Hypothetical predicted protein [Pelobates cultripes]|uniref:Uncharacterized protein n=1 Tax=Pelobates cultripes TaxID=61616 RepID=A0AAD1TDU6_PELCU|nr:Hypothetical predicted protein [Pelobates cultripes]
MRLVGSGEWVGNMELGEVLRAGVSHADRGRRGVGARDKSAVERGPDSNPTPPTSKESSSETSRSRSGRVSGMVPLEKTGIVDIPHRFLGSVLRDKVFKKTLMEMRIKDILDLIFGIARHNNRRRKNPIWKCIVLKRLDK